MATTVAQIDLSLALQGDSDDDWNSVAEALGKGLHELGVVYLVGHGIDAKSIDNVFDISKQLFDLPAEVKKKHSKLDATSSDYFNGFSAAGEEILNYDLDSYEVKESFDISMTKPKYPEEDVPGFQSTIQNFTTAVETLKRTVLRLLSQAVDIDQDYIEQTGSYMDRDDVSNFTALRILKYMAVPPDFRVTSGTIRCAEHFDWDILTFLFQDNVGGLEAKTREGRWITVPPVPNSIILIAGEILEAWTRGYYPAVVHRILLTEEDERIRRDRYSFGYFIFPDNDLVISPFEKTNVLTEDSNFTPVTTKTLIQNHVIKSHPEVSKSNGSEF